MIEKMYASGVRTFLEVGPGARLTGLTSAILNGKDHAAFALDASAGKRSGIADAARAMARLAALGCRLDLNSWENGEAGIRDAEKKVSKLAVKLSGVKRLLIVGGAGSLEIAPGLQLVDSPSFPAEWKSGASAARGGTLRG